ncbi:MAG TPA: hypothetical protein VGQ41_13850 [Pyrinomonadaceae bacterium]|jgi:hypothetical protein|nr:hypothetical protein [Pyrinomonadaceae bacterium]
MRVCLFKIGWVVLGFIFTAVVLPSAQAQTPNDQLETHIPPREHQEFLRKAREGELVRPGNSQRQQLRLSQIREDFRRIQLINAEKIRPALMTNTLDYKNIAKASSEIERRAVRLKSNLALPDSGEKTESLDGIAESYLNQIKRLDKVIWNFVSNPLFRNTETIDVGLAAKASRDLREIIQVSAWLKTKHD